MSTNEESNYVKRLREHTTTIQKAINYSIERFDILIISLSTSALILSMGFVEDIIKDFSNTNLTLLKVSWALFLSALIVNLLSQVSGYFANKCELKITQDIISAEKKNNEYDTKKSDKIKNFFDVLTYVFNALSLLALIIGVTILVIFITINK
jgi:hypothetical protein